MILKMKVISYMKMKVISKLLSQENLMVAGDVRLKSIWGGVEKK